MKSMRWLLLLLLGVWGCMNLSGPGDDGTPELADADLRVAFVGNSLTYVGNVPGLVQALADADGRSMAHVTLARPNYSLQDHWYTGTPNTLRDLGADVVVLQQGPSTTMANREHLLDWSRRFAPVIREAGGEPALYMVWPEAARPDAFPAVWMSYRGAARVAEGAFIPAGQTWVEAWAVDPTLELYSADGFHQSELGALAAAMTIYAVLYRLPADSVPELDGEVSAEVWTALRAGLAESLTRADTATTERPGTL